MLIPLSSLPPLLSPLSSLHLIWVNNPDLVMFVREALVGNEVVDQLVKFNRALADHSDTKEPHLMSHSTISEYALSLSACILLPSL